VRPAWPRARRRLESRHDGYLGIFHQGSAIDSETKSRSFYFDAAQAMVGHQLDQLGNLLECQHVAFPLKLKGELI
jgi:hypothetical protein